MDTIQSIVGLLPQIGIAGVVAVALVAVSQRGISHYEADIEYQRKKIEQLEARIIDLEAKMFDLLKKAQ